jgi:hypothetical protein
MLWSGKQGKRQTFRKQANKSAEDTFCALRLIRIFDVVSDSYFLKADLDQVFLMNVGPDVHVVLFEKNYKELFNVFKNSLLF